MENITKELEKQDAVICLRCGSIYKEVTTEEFYDGDCDVCGKGGGYLNWVLGDLHAYFWGSPAQKEIAEEFE